MIADLLTNCVRATFYEMINQMIKIMAKSLTSVFDACISFVRAKVFVFMSNLACEKSGRRLGSSS